MSTTTDGDQTVRAVDYAVHGIREGLLGDHDQLDILQRAMLIDMADDMELVRHLLLRLKDAADMSTDAEDARAAVRRLQREFATMDALGWPGEDR